MALDFLQENANASIRAPSGSPRESGTDFAPSMCPVFPDTEADAREWGCTSNFRQNQQPSKEYPPSAGGQYPQGCCEVRLPDGRVAVMLDIGSVGNLTGSEWARLLHMQARKNGRSPQSVKRDRPLNVSGVGNGSQHCHYNVDMPCAIPTTTGFIKGTFNAPCVPNSSLPALLGLRSLHDSRAIIDTMNNRLYLVGPGDFDLLKSLPPGTSCVQCQYSTSGHMMMPVDAYEGLDQQEKNGGLTIEKELALPTTSSIAEPGS